MPDLNQMEAESGFIPAFQQVQGPQGVQGIQGQRGEKGDTGPVGGGPVWAFDYPIYDVTVPTGQAAQGSWPMRTSGVANEGVGGGRAQAIEWKLVPFVMPSRTPPAKELEVIDPGYEEYLPTWLALYEEWRRSQPVDVNDVELGLWIEATTLTEFCLGLSGPEGGVFLGKFTLHPGTEEYPPRRMGYGLQDHEMVWFTDDGADRYAAGYMRRWTNVGELEPTPSGWAGPSSEFSYEVENQMRDLFARSRWNGLWSGATIPPDVSQWRLAIGHEWNGFGAGGGEVIVRGARLRLRRYARRFEIEQRKFTRFDVPAGVLEPPRGRAHYLHGSGANKMDLPIRVPAYNGSGGSNRRWMNWRSIGWDANLDPSDAALDQNSQPLYRFGLAFPRTVLAVVRAGITWSRFAAGADPTTATPLVQVPGQWLAAMLVIDSADGLLGVGNLAQDSRLSIRRIYHADEPIVHTMFYVGPVTRAGILLVNGTSQAREPVGADDGAYGVHPAYHDPGGLPLWSAPFLQVTELDDRIGWDSGIPDELYRHQYEHTAQPYAGP